METKNHFKYYAFISYKREDEEWAKWLQHKLEHYKLPSNLNGRSDLPKEIRPIFRDTSELNPGNLPQQIYNALEQSRYLIIICSPRSAQSEWVNREVETFIAMGRTDKIIPFIIEGTAFASNSSMECFPLAVRNLPSDQEILGANINEMGRDAAAVKVVAQMFGVRFDELWQRYEREQRRKRLLIILAALLLALTGAGVAIGFSQQNKRIRKQSEEILNKNERLQNDSIVMAAQMDSINQRDRLILQQQDSIEITNGNLEVANEQLTTERNNLKATNWKMMESRSRFAAEKANILVDEGDSYLAQRLLLEVLPESINHQNKPLTTEAEIALRKASGHTTAVLKGHTNRTLSADYSPDGNYIVSTSYDGTMRLWDAKTGKEIRVLDHSHVKNATFSPDGKRIAAIKDNEIRIWDTKTGKETMSLEGHLGTVYSISFSPNGKRIASASGGVSGSISHSGDSITDENFVEFLLKNRETEPDNTIKIWNVETGKEIITLEGHQDRVLSVAYSPNGKYLVSASNDGTLRIWDAETGKEIKKLRKNNIDFAAFSPDGKHIISVHNHSSRSGSNIIIWDIETEKAIMELDGHSSKIFSVAYSPDSKLIASASSDKTIRIWNAATGEEIKVLKGHTDDVNSVRFSPNGKNLISASFDNTLRIWELAIEMETKELTGHTNSVWSVAYSPDGKSFVSTSLDGSIRIWDARTGMVKKKLEGHTEPATSAQYSPNGKRIVTASQDKTIKVWDAETGRETMNIEGHTGCVYSVAFSPDGKRIVSASGADLTFLINFDDFHREDNTIRIWDAGTGNEIRVLKGHKGEVKSAAYSPDGKHIVSGGSDGTIRVWNAETGKETMVLHRGQSNINSVVYSPDGKRIASASSDKTIRIFDAKTGTEIRKIEGHTDGVYSVAFSSDNKYLVSASADHTIRVWNPNMGENIIELDGHSKNIHSVAFSPDDRHIASASFDNTIRIWSFPPLQELIDQAREHFKDYPLTPEERRMYYLE